MMCIPLEDESDIHSLHNESPFQHGKQFFMCIMTTHKQEEILISTTNGWKFLLQWLKDVCTHPVSYLSRVLPYHFTHKYVWVCKKFQGPLLHALLSLSESDNQRPILPPEKEALDAHSSTSGWARERFLLCSASGQSGLAGRNVALQVRWDASLNLARSYLIWTESKPSVKDFKQIGF